MDLASCDAALASRHPDAGAHCRALLDGDDTIRLIGYGALLAQKGRLEEALDPLRKAARLDPEDYAPQFNLGLTYFNLRKYADARAPLERAVSLRPESFSAVALLGSALAAMGEDLAAADYLRRANRLEPGDPKVHALLLQEITVAAQEATRKASYQQAASLSREALTLQPDSADFHNLLGFCLLQQGDRNQALASFERAIAANPDLKPAHKNLAGLLVLQGRVTEAVAEFTALLRLEPNEPVLRRALFDLAKQRFAKEDYSNTVELLRLAEPGTDRSAEWYDLMGYSQYRLGDSAQAVAKLQTAMEMAPGNEDYVLELAEVFTAGNNAEAALTMLQAALKVFPESARMWFAVGVARLANSDLASAENALRRSLKLDPKLDLAYQVLCHGYRDAGMWDQLAAAAEMLIQVNAANHFGYFYRALVLLRAGHAQAAEIEALLRKSIALDGEDPEPRYELSKLLLEKGDKAASSLELEALLKVSPEFGPAYYRLYQLYKDRGDEKNSKEALEAYQHLRAQRGLPVRQLIVKVRQP
jgi:superkiller protein 3